MLNKNYKLRFLPTFYRDLYFIAQYIAKDLKSPVTANRFVDEVELAINKRLDCPDAFEPYQSKKERKTSYYRINVKNYSIFYVLIDDYMEIRRIIYSRRNISKQLG